MLAQNFKSADDLAITEEQKNALIKTLALLETRQLEYSRDFDTDYEEEPERAFSGKFNMRYWTEHSPCGTIACIGGTAELISGVAFPYADHNGLRRLFQPNIPVKRWARITTDEAATALRNYLTTGMPSWHEVVPPSPQETASE